MTELHYLSATKALDLFRSRQLSPVELTQALIARAEAVEPVVNALAERMFDRALEAAAEAERRYAGGGAEARRLEGLPVAMKEEHSIAGHTTSEGTLLRTPRIATTTDVLPARVRAAGGILHARTTTAEFCCLPMSHLGARQLHHRLPRAPRRQAGLGVRGKDALRPVRPHRGWRLPAGNPDHRGVELTLKP